MTQNIKTYLKSLFLSVLLCLPATGMAGQATYSYDSLDRLVKKVYDNGVMVKYFYDADGNLSNKSVIDNVLNYAADGHGAGSIGLSSTGDEACGADCYIYENATTVTLTATPDGNSFFYGWGGDCGGTGDCLLIVDGLKYVTATFKSASFSPTALSAELLSETSVSLSWFHDHVGESGFYVERKTGGGSFDTITTLPENSLSYTDTGLTPGQDYTYRVAAYDGGGQSDYSNEEAVTMAAYTITVTATGNGTITPPGDVTVYDGNDKTFTITPFSGFSTIVVKEDGLSVGVPAFHTFSSISAGHTLHADFTAEFTGCTNEPVRIASAPTVYYSTLQAAYDAATSSDTIQAHGRVISGNVAFNRAIDVTVDGGYDCNFTTLIGKKTVISGDVDLASGGGIVDMGNISID